METRSTSAEIIDDLATTADKLRALTHADYSRAENENILGVRPQHVRNVIFSIMVKRLAILAVVLTVAYASGPATGQTSDKGASGAQQQDKGINDGKSPPQPTPQVPHKKDGDRSDKPESERIPDTDQQPAINISESAPVPESWSWHDKLLWIASLILAGVGVFGVFAAVCTLVILKRQTRFLALQTVATRRAANTALRQTRHMIASERAWVLIDTGEIPDDFESDTSTVQMMDIRPVIRNSGKTPARIIRVSLRTHQIAKGEQLPAEPEYKNISEIEITLPPSVPLQPMGTMISLSDFIAIRRGDVVLYVYGFVDYLDFAEQERRSGFCFVYLLGGGFTSMKRGFYIATQVPKIYRRNA